MAAEPIDFREIEAWASLRRVDLSDWEISALRRMDTARRAALAGGEQQQQQVSARPMSPALFKALFG